MATFAAAVIAIDTDNHRVIVIYTDGVQKFNESVPLVANWIDLVRSRAVALDAQTDMVKNITVGPVDLTPPVATVPDQGAVDKDTYLKLVSKLRAFQIQVDLGILDPSDPSIDTAKRAAKDLYKPEYICGCS